MLKKYVQCFDSAKKFHLLYNNHFPLDGKRELLHQKVSILHPLAILSSDVQSKTKPLGWYNTVHLCVMRSDGHLNRENPIIRFDDQNLLPYERPLMEECIKFRERLIFEMDKRFFIKKYVELTDDLLFDCQLFLHPAYKTFDYVPMLRKVMSDMALMNSKLMT